MRSKCFYISLLLLACMALRAAPVRTVSLNGIWKLQYWPQPEEAITNPLEIKGIQVAELSATVPGNVELDLFTTGKIDDPMIGSNVHKLRTYENYQWCYSRQFASPSVESGQKVILNFGGIDCLSDIWLNGFHLASTDNMFIDQNFDITKYLKEDGTQNELQVILRSAVMEGQKHLLGTFSVQADGFGESVFIRKAPSSYGWDIMPRLVSAGLWRNVEMQIVNPVRLTDVFWMTERVDIKKKQANGCVDIQLKAPFSEYDKIKAVATLSYNGKTVYKQERVLSNMNQRMYFRIDDASFWWPRGYGESALYDAEIQIQNEQGETLSADKRKIGLRTVFLDRSEINTDEDGRFCFVVNGEKIFIRGTNWVPLDAFHSRDASFVKSTIDMVADLNCNMIRCWGGNVYEDNVFFDLCDENGILVWQDFSMACTFYPQRDQFATQIEKEAISIVLKLRNHPSLALWSGNNEDDESFTWALSAFRQNPNRDRISRHVLPQVIYEFDPTRPYLPSSPYFSQAVYDRGSQLDDLPERHLWGPRGYYKAPFYTEEKARFVSEIGYHGCPNRESLEKMFTKEAVYPWTKDFEWNDEWMTKSVRTFDTKPWTDARKSRNDLMINQIRVLFGSVPKDLDDFIQSSQFVQAEAMKFFIERWRGGKFDKAGIIWWNVRDGWPIISDAVVDYYNSKKLAYSFIKNVQHNVCVFLNDAVGGTYPLIAVNDTRKPVSGKVSVTDVQSGNLLYEGDFVVDVNGKSLIANIAEMKGQGVLLIRYDVNGKSQLNHYLYGQPPFKLNEYKRLLQKTGIYKTSGI